MYTADAAELRELPKSAGSLRTGPHVRGTVIFPKIDQPCVVISQPERPIDNVVQLTVLLYRHPQRRCAVIYIRDECQHVLGQGGSVYNVRHINRVPALAQLDARQPILVGQTD